jgi:hypothetical protein
MSKSDYFALAAVLISLVSAGIAWLIGRRTLRITTYRSATDLMLEVDRIFVDYPQLRRYFHDQEICPQSHPDYNLVQAVAELELDVLECIWDSRKSYTKADRISWTNYILGALKSPAVKDMYDDPDNKGWYPTLDRLTGRKVPPHKQWWSRYKQWSSRPHSQTSTQPPTAAGTQ